MRKPLALFAACFSCLFCPSVQASKHPAPAPPNSAEVHAELLTHLYVGRVKPGDPILAKVIDPWDNRDCKLRKGSIITGHVLKAETSTVKSGISSMEIAFDDAECNDKPSTPFPLTLVTILPSSNGGDADQLASKSLIDTLYSAENLVNSYERALSYKGDLAFALTNVTSTSENVNAQLPPGKVVGYKQMHLDAGVGPENASKVYMMYNNLRLERTTNMILLPSPGNPTPAETNSRTSVASKEPSETPANTPAISPASRAIAEVSPPPPPEPEPIDETDICSSICNTAGDASAALRAAASSYRLSIANLGFAANLNRPLTSFEYDATLTYLDESNLLFTFDPHKLRHRVGTGVLNQPVRTIRAVLIDPKAHVIKHVYEWDIYDHGQYLWPAGPGQILVHVNRQLSLLGPTLNLIHSLPLAGPLAWASVSPSGNHFVVGTIRERHTEPLHRLILEHTGVDPEEDVDVRLYDSDFKLLLSASQSSTDRPTILSDSGELRLHAIGDHRWQLDEERWDRSTRPLITSTSYCRPTISAQKFGHLFLAGCADRSGLRWYRMLRPDGHPVLKRSSPLSEIEHSADTAASSAFAVRVVKATKTLYPGDSFNKVDLGSEEISIYRVRDGHQIFTTSTDDMPLMVQSFALSPTGRNMVLLDNKSISFYTIGAAQP